MDHSIARPRLSLAQPALSLLVTAVPAIIAQTSFNLSKSEPETYDAVLAALPGRYELPELGKTLALRQKTEQTSKSIQNIELPLASALISCRPSYIMARSK